MADPHLFFIVEYPYAAYSVADQTNYISSKRAFIRKFRTAMAADITGKGITEQDYAFNMLKERLTLYGFELTWFDYDSDNVEDDALLDLKDLSDSKSELAEGQAAVRPAAYPGAALLRSPTHRFWGTVKYPDVYDKPRSATFIRCAIRAIFYPCVDKDTSTDRCAKLDGINFEAMKSVPNEGNYILGVFRWAAWLLREDRGPTGRLFQEFVGNGGGGGDH